MKVLLSWLREFVDVPGTPEEIAATMSVRGLAVESIEPIHGFSAEASAKAEDAVFDFETFANRPDTMSVIGIAREVATAYRLPLKAGPPAAGPALRTETRRPGSAEDSEGPRSGPGDIDILIDNPELCPRYAGAIADVTVGPSAAWMQQRLTACGVRPISNIVDITNYVLLELGQPMHAFDLTTLAGRQIRVRAARPGEKLKTLDGQLRALTPDMLVIADAERATAIAGVMGGADSEVTDATTTIVFESAYFNPLSVRRTSKKLGLKTEASMRFERGADPRLPAIAMERACALLEATGAGRSRGTIVDRYPQPVEPTTVRLRRSRIAAFLGIAIPDADVTRILESLGFALEAADTAAPPAASGWDVTVPTRRVDIVREVDVIEEIARHFGFDNVPVTFPALSAPAPKSDPRIARARQLRTVLTANGFSEAVTFGFIGEAAAAPFAAPGDLVPITNPLSENFAVLRPSALPGIIDAVAHNRRREQRDVRLFEIGASFSRAAGERRAVACAWTGAAAGDHWSGGARDVDFFDLKGVVERIGEALRIEVRTEPHEENWLTAGRAAAVVSGSIRIGVLGQLATAVAERHGLPGPDPVYVAEIDLDAAERLAPQQDARVEALPRYPSVTRDISILVDDGLAAEEVRRAIREAAPATLVRVREFDRYQGKGVPDGKVSLSVRLTFRSPDRTLLDTDVQAAMDAVLAALKERHAAVQR
jgi:phenylalanyl-tRNA synthetase beta chain